MSHKPLTTNELWLIKCRLKVSGYWPSNQMQNVQKDSPLIQVSISQFLIKYNHWFYILFVTAAEPCPRWVLARRQHSISPACPTHRQATHARRLQFTGTATADQELYNRINSLILGYINTGKLQSTGTETTDQELYYRTNSLIRLSHTWANY